MNTKRARTRLSPELRKKQILDTAKRLIIKGGLQKFTMEALAKEASVTAPLVYNYFSSRTILLQELLLQEHKAFTQQVTAEVTEAENFKGIVRVFIKSNFDHQSQGNILPILQSQPEINIAIADEQKANSRQTAMFLVRSTAKSFRLTTAQAELVASMSSGASIAAAQYASRHDLDPSSTIELALTYVLAGMASIVGSN
jgi:AcrR family transcriptional regulator